MIEHYFAFGPDAFEYLELINTEGEDFTAVYLAETVLGLLLPQPVDRIPQGCVLHEFQFGNRKFLMYWSYKRQYIGLVELEA